MDLPVPALVLFGLGHMLAAVGLHHLSGLSFSRHRAPPSALSAVARRRHNRTALVRSNIV